MLLLTGVKDGSVGSKQCLHRHNMVFKKVKAFFTLDLKKALEDDEVS